MLRKVAYNKIFRTTGMLIILGLLFLFPVSKEYSLEKVSNYKKVMKEKESIVYLLDKNNYISRVGINLSMNNKEEYAKNLVELLIIDGKYESLIPNGFKGILPSNVSINSLVIQGDSITIDLSKDFYDISKEFEQKAVELLTYNLTSIDNVNKLFINIDGKKLNKLSKSSINLSQPFTRQDGVNKDNSSTSYKDVSKTTIYYIGKNNDSYYYIPVTKIKNDKREKIEVIIDELSSSNTYGTNLISMLNYNTKLTSYKIENNNFILSFNKYIFDDLISKKILEEVVYTISLSVKENYNVNEVIFNVNNEEITKSVLKNIE